MIYTNNIAASRLAVLGFVVAAMLSPTAARLSEGDACRMADQSPGICRIHTDCPILREAVERHVISVNDIQHCGFSGLEEIVCCPSDTTTGRPIVESQLIFEKNQQKGEFLSPPKDEFWIPSPFTIARTLTPPTVKFKTWTVGLEGPKEPSRNLSNSRNHVLPKQSSVLVPSGEFLIRSLTTPTIKPRTRNIGLDNIDDPNTNFFNSRDSPLPKSSSVFVPDPGNPFLPKVIVPSSELEAPSKPYRNLSVSRNPFLARASFWLLQNRQANKDTNGSFGDGNKNYRDVEVQNSFDLITNNAEAAATLTAPFLFGDNNHIGSREVESDRYSNLNTESNATKPRPTITEKGDPKQRPAEIACQNLEAHLAPDLADQILDGTPVDRGEYPHMAAIGYSRSLSENGPYDFRCGGTLIHKQFVLTAAHCVNIRDGTLKIVRLGVVDLLDKKAIDIPIKEIYSHPEYSNIRKVNDIAIIELEYPVNYSSTIFPTCLYTNSTDPDTALKLYVTGWGNVNTTTYEASDILLKARLQMVSLDNCRNQFQLFGQEVRNTHICAADPGLTKDACQGDSGGPLNAVLNPTLKQYRVVGIIMSGIGCATVIPGLYARVASYLDFIEGIVWPADKPERLLY